MILPKNGDDEFNHWDFDPWHPETGIKYFDKKKLFIFTKS